jgi:GTPase SAR1 family protein
MNTQLTTPNQTATPPETLRIGIYGCTNAGKTTFLHALLEYWTDQKRIIPKNTAVLGFMQRTAAEVEAYGSVRPTTAESTDLSITLRRDKNESDLEITCRDLRGELLSDDLDATAPGNANGPLRGQIQECDAFLFFFDPTAREHQAAPDKHYDREFQRAEKLLEAVLSTRENRYLPIVFVLTHHDQWQRDATIIANVQRWKTRLIDRMKELYRTRYKGLRPNVLTNREQIFIETAATEQTADSNRRLEAVIHRLATLSRRCKGFLSIVRRRFLLIAMLASIAVLIPVVLLLLPRGSPEPKPGKTIAALLDRHAKDLGVGMPAEASQIADYAIKLHRILVDLLTVSGGEVNSEPQPTATDVTAAARMLEDAAQKLMKEGKAAEVDRDTRLQLLGVTLGGLQRPAEGTTDPLTPAYELYWRIADDKTRASLRTTVKERKNVGSPPRETLRRLAAQAEELRKEHESYAVAVTPQGEGLLTQLRETQSFCEDRVNAGAYSVSVLVLGEQNTDGDSPFASRYFAIDCNADPRFTTPLIPAENEKSVLLRARIRWGKQAWENYKNDVSLTLGGVKSGKFDAFRDGAFKTTVTSRPGKRSDLGAFAGALSGSESLAVTIDVNVSKEHWFLVHSKQHGELKGRTVSLAELVSNKPEPFELNLEGKGSKGNVLELIPTLVNSLRYVPTKAGPQEVAIPLGSSLRCLVYVGDKTPAASVKPIIDFDPISKPGPLAVLGMPLVPSRTESTVAAQGTDAGGKFTVKVDFDCKNNAPQLLWDVTTEAVGKSP